jgi:C1A family cysteine protease
MTNKVYLTIDQLQKKKENALKRPLIKLDGVNLPSSTSLQSQVVQIYDQGSEGSCTANSFCAAFQMMQSDKTFYPSRQYIYYKERLIEAGYDPTVITDSGANVLDGIEYAQQYGICSENLWPYELDNINTPPTLECDTDALSHKIGTSGSIQINDSNSIKQSLINGVPVMIAICVHESFELVQNGIIPMPNFQSRVDPILGGHEVLLVGYNDTTNSFQFLNSWGTSWGQNGFGYLPYEYVSNPNLTYSLSVIQKFND